jgi:hypothetical protein
MQKIHFITYAEGSPYTETQAALNETIGKFTGYEVVRHAYDLDRLKGLPLFDKIADLPTFNYHGRRDGYYCAYKVIIPAEVYESMGENDILYYCDSSRYFMTGFEHSIDRLAEYCFTVCPFIAGSFGTDVLNSSYGCCDKREVWGAVDSRINYEKVIGAPHVLASWFMMKKCSQNTQFFADWLKYSFLELEGRPLITYHHPGDQSIFNILCHKYGFKSFFDPAIRHDENKDRNRVLEMVNRSTDLSKLFVPVSLFSKSYAIIVPVHPPHYQYIYDLLKKLKLYKIALDLFLVFSSQDDYETFSMKDGVKPIIAENINMNATTTSKKFYALKKLMNSGYDYFIVCDAEIDIVPENFTANRILQKIEAIFEKRLLYGGEVQGNPLGEKIINACVSIFSEYEAILVRHKVAGLYTWWSDLPVYKREHLPHFFARIGPLDRLTWNHFDHVMYQYYLLVHHDFRIVNITPITGVRWSLEHLMIWNEKMLEDLQAAGYGAGWITKKNFHTAAPAFLKCGTFLIYHMDHF